MTEPEPMDPTGAAQRSGRGRHARPTGAGRPGRALLRAGVTLAAAGAALAAGGAAAQAAPAEPAGASAPDEMEPGAAAAAGLKSAVTNGLAPATDLQLNPLANTAVDPLNNAVGTQIADFKPLSTEIVTGPLARGASLGDLPVADQVTGLLKG
ncbi:hypothetical protein [Streptomyces sp. YIM 130001]|uniref:hypothetical protein n=1 Tax=Streptomyces sp. YIM 130001 TaxID=2259644 RepID=UPI001F08BC72|nr:hypothetical protein [Streptomyces sp. YIM 130001]